MRVECHGSLAALAIFVSAFGSNEISGFWYCHALNNISPYSRVVGP